MCAIKLSATMLNVMANTKQAKKMIRKIKRRTSYNRWWKGKIKKSIDDVNTILSNANPNVNELNEKVVIAQKTIDKAAKNNVIHKNKANRLKAKLLRSTNTKTTK